MVKLETAATSDVLADLHAARSHRQAGQLQPALEICQAVLAREPRQLDALRLLGELQLHSGHANEAVATWRRFLELQPTALGALLLLGTALRAAGDEAAAEQTYSRLVQLAPEVPEGHFALGRLVAARGRSRDALVHLERALELRPQWPEVLNELGVVHLRGVDGGADGHKAADHFRHAARLAQEWLVPHHNLGEALEVAGDMDAAVATYEEVLERWPQSDATRRNHTYGLLKLGRYEAGWQAHEWRFAAGGRTPPREGWDAEVWDGSPFPGRTLVVWTEQGLGDHVQFVRYLPRVAALGGRVWLQSPEPLARLMSTCPGVDRVVVGDPPAAEVDLQIPLLSLPKIFGTTLETVPAEVPYLHPPVAVPDVLRPCLEAAGDKPRVGLVWKSGALAPGHAARDLDAAAVRKILDTPEIDWFALQYGERLADLVGELPPEVSLEELGHEVGDFATTAAIVARLDLVITVDTASLHLAGALGVPVWALISAPGDWRWLTRRDDSPWYPTVRLFRQERPGVWSDPVDKLLIQLREEIGSFNKVVSLQDSGHDPLITERSSLSCAPAHANGGVDTTLPAGAVCDGTAVREGTAAGTLEHLEGVFLQL